MSAEPGSDQPPPAAAAVVFPGQGSQRVGMGADLYAAHPTIREVFDRAGEVLGYDLASFCLHGPASELARTRCAQPALFALSVGIWRLLADRGVQPICAAGHSIGEFAAWVASGAIEFEEALLLVRKRAELMEEAAKARKGAMSAMLGLPVDQVQQICEQASTVGAIAIAGCNCPGQVVVSGVVRAVERAEELARRAGARVVRLAVAGAFHSPLMAEAAKAFAAEVERAPIRKAKIPVAANATGRLTQDVDDIRQAMREQMLKPVLWEAGMRAMISLGARLFIEAGGARVLSGMAVRIDPSVRPVPVDDVNGLEKATGALKDSG